MLSELIFSDMTITNKMKYNPIDCILLQHPETYERFLYQL